MATEFHEVKPETAAALAARAKALGVTVDTLLKRFLSDAEPVRDKNLTAADIDQTLDELSKDTENVPPLPPGFSREDIYVDHD